MQWLAVPFAFLHPAVTNISETKEKWIGTLKPWELGNWFDSALLLIFGGIPWQVGNHNAHGESPITQNFISMPPPAKVSGQKLYVI